MKKYFFLLLLLPGWVCAQNSQVIAAGDNDDLMDKVSTHLQFLFPEFTNGEVYFRNAPKGTGTLNYNMLAGEMQFLEDDEIMGIANVKDVVVVNIANRMFYPYNHTEFAEEILVTDNCRLRVRRKGSIAQHSKSGAYGTSSSTASITSYSSVNTDGRQYGLNVASNVLISLNYFYYLVGTNGKYTQIKNVKTFTKQFPVYKAQIETFVKERNIHFNKEEDLKALIVYCSELSN